jgi:hypothetical protein
MNRLAKLWRCVVIIMAAVALTYGTGQTNISGPLKTSALPVVFTENQGQWGSKTLFKGEIGGATFYFCRDEVAYLFIHSTEENAPAVNDKPRLPTYKQDGILVKAAFLGSNPDVQVLGEHRLGYNNNYFYGSDQSRWHTDVLNYSAIVYKELYPGIDLRYLGNGQALKYDFIVKPGADISSIKIKYDGVNNLSVAANGDLQATTTFGPIGEKAPFVYQQVNGIKRPISGRYRMIGENTFGFAIDGSYDLSQPLIIDPQLVYSTFWGGSLGENTTSLALDSAGNTYLLTTTSSVNIPLVSPYDSTLNGTGDINIVKLSTSTNTIFYSTYIGGNAGDISQDIAVDTAGNAFVMGLTTSLDFPTLNGFDNAYDGSNDYFVVKLSPAGNELIYGTYLGGSSEEGNTRTWNHSIGGMCIDQSGCVYLAGSTQSIDYPVINSYDDSFHGGDDICITKLSPDGSSLVFSTYLGGTHYEEATDITVDILGRVYFSGCTGSNDYPSVNSYITPYPYYYELYNIVSVLSANGQELLLSSYFSMGSDFDMGSGIAVDSEYNIYIYGTTEGNSIPTFNSYQGQNNGESDLFLIKFGPFGSSLLYGTYLGGGNWDFASRMAIDNSGRAYLTGYTQSADFPVINSSGNVFQSSYDPFVAVISTTDRCLLYSTIISAQGTNLSRDIALDNSGIIHIAGVVNSTNFSTTSNAIFPNPIGGADGFLLEVLPDSFTVNLASLEGTVRHPTAGPQNGFIVSLKNMGLTDTTDGTGHYLLTGLCPKNYNIVISKSGYADTTLNNILLQPGQTTNLDVVMRPLGAISGVVKDINSLPVADAIVALRSHYYYIKDWTDSLGNFILPNLAPGIKSLACLYRPNVVWSDSTIVVNAAETTRLEIILPDYQHDVDVYFGNPDLSPINAPIGGTTYINAYARTAPNVYLANIHLCIATQEQYFDSLISRTNGRIYPPLTQWDECEFRLPEQHNDEYLFTNPPGWYSQSFVGFSDLGGSPNPWFHSDTLVKIATFAFKCVNNPALLGDTIKCFRTGYSNILGMAQGGDTVGGPGYNLIQYFSPIVVVSPEYYCSYLLGDINGDGNLMGSDVTYIVRYFKGFGPPPPDSCYLDSLGDYLYPAADVNGNCELRGSDVTRLVGYFKSIASINCCHLAPSSGPKIRHGEPYKPE